MLDDIKKNRKNLLILDNLHSWKNPSPEFEEDYDLDMKIFSKLAESKNVNVFHANYDWININKGIVNKYWVLENDKWSKKGKKIKPDLYLDYIDRELDYELYNLKNKLARKTPFINSPNMTSIMGNKFAQYLLFAEFMPFTSLCNTVNDLYSNINKIKSSKVVIKPIHGYGGNGISILDKKDFRSRIKKIKLPCLIQNFIKSNGIPGLKDTGRPMDLRMVFVNHRLCCSFVRVAKKGSLLTNFCPGGAIIHIRKNKIPKSLFKISNNIIEKLKSFSTAHYSLDFYFDEKNAPHLIEINLCPGFGFALTDMESKLFYFAKLLECISN